MCSYLLEESSLLILCNNMNFSCVMSYNKVRRGRGYARVYGYQAVSMRSHEEHLQHATEAEATRKVSHSFIFIYKL